MMSFDPTTGTRHLGIFCFLIAKKERKLISSGSMLKKCTSSWIFCNLVKKTKKKKKELQNYVKKLMFSRIYTKFVVAVAMLKMTDAQKINEQLLKVFHSVE